MKQKKALLILVLIILPFCLYAAGLKEAYNCGQAAQMLQINADAYHDPAPTVEDILAGVSPYMPLTRMEGCKMLLRAFGPLPDVQEGVRYLVKYRDCKFTDVPEDGKEAVENLTNAGLYIPEDDTKFGPNELMTESELAVLVDRIHAYLQSSPKDDFYSWSYAELLNDPYFFYGGMDYDFSNVNINYNNYNARREWTLNLLNECLENPDTPAKKNIAAFMSTYMDMEERENSMTYIQPMVEAIWNAADFYELMDVLADIRRETGLELLLTRNLWTEFKVFLARDNSGTVHDLFKLDYVSEIDPEYLIPGEYYYDASVEQNSRLLSVLGINEEEAKAAAENFYGGFLRQFLYDYAANPGSVNSACIGASVTEPFEFLPMDRYLERAGYGTDWVYLKNSGEYAAYFRTAVLPQYLSGLKVDTIWGLIRSLDRVVPARVRDAVSGFWDAFFAAYPSLYYEDTELSSFVSFLVHSDIAEYFSQTEEYIRWHELLEDLCSKIKQYFRRMIENSSWLSDATRQVIFETLDTLTVELLVPSKLSEVLHVEYVSAQDGGTMFGNITRFLKARYDYMSKTALSPELIWSIENAAFNMAFYFSSINTYFLDLSAYVASHALEDPCIETIMGYIGTTIAHEISHSFENRDDVLEAMPQEDIEEFIAHFNAFAEYMSGCEMCPGLAVEDGHQIVNEAAADYHGFICTLAIAREIPGFDYDKYFRAFANQFAVTGSPQGFINNCLYDVHPTGRCRVNKLLSLVDEFYTTYDVKEGDAMYVAPENRPYIW